jgi:hypothetical protein
LIAANQHVEADGIAHNHIITRTRGDFVVATSTDQPVANQRGIDGAAAVVTDEFIGKL